MSLSVTKVAGCELCGGELEQATMGRPRRFCSAACRQAAYRRRHAKPRRLVLTPELRRFLKAEIARCLNEREQRRREADRLLFADEQVAA